jgi:uncharacterized membrane protein YbhN (UPF0104 family)
MPAARRLLRPVLGAAVLLTVLVGVDPAAVAERFASADLVLVLPAIAGLTAMHLVPTAGWRAMLAAGGRMRLPWRRAVALYYAAQAIGGVTPANVGGDIHRAAALRRWGEGWQSAVAPLVIQRATSYLALSAVALAGLWLIAGRAQVAGELVAIGAAFAAGVAIVAWVLVLPPRPLRRAQRRMVAVVGGDRPERWEATAGLRRSVLIGAASGLLFHAGSIGLTWLLVIAVDPAAATPLVPAALAIARLSLAVPLTPSGIGLQEGALALLFGALGLQPDSALAAMLLARLALLLTTLIGVALILRPAEAPPVAGPATPSAPLTPAR